MKKICGLLSLFFICSFTIGPISNAESQSALKETSKFVPEAVIKYSDEQIKAKIRRVSSKAGHRLYYKKAGLVIEIEVESTAEKKYIRPVNSDGEGPEGISVEDNYGNKLILLAVQPYLYGNTTLKPKKQYIFTIYVQDTPLEQTTYLRLEFSPNSIGNKNTATFVIPVEMIGDT